MGPRTNLKYVINFSKSMTSTTSSTVFTFDEPMTFDRIIISGMLQLRVDTLGLPSVHGLFILRSGATAAVPTSTIGFPPYPVVPDILWTQAWVTAAASADEIIPLK